MGKDAQKSVELTDEAKKKLKECVAALSACGFGDEGPPKNTTFAEIEDFGHQMGQIVARAVDEQLTTQHAAHFQERTPCPSCETPCPPKDVASGRDFKTTDGDVPLHEPVFHCPVCNRDFFPSTYRIED